MENERALRNTAMRRSRTQGSNSRSRGGAPSTSAPASPVIQTPPMEDAEESVTINWTFVSGQEHFLRDIVSISIAQSRFKAKLSTARTRFREAIAEEFDIKTRNRDISFWILKEKVDTITALTEEWGRNHLANFKSNLVQIPSSSSFDKTIPKDQLDDEDCLHLVVTDQRLFAVSENRVETEDTVGELPPQRLFRETLKDQGLSPSKAARSKEYAQVQSKRTQRIYDGRYVVGKGGTIAPPVDIFHPIFDRFRERTRILIPDNETLLAVHEFMKMASQVHPNEADYAAQMRSALTAILKISITLETNKDTTASDGVYSIDLGQGIKLSIGLVEFKQGLGEGGSDATIQAGLSMKRLWSDDAKAATVHVRSKCCCPTLMIAGGGPWLSVLGGVFTDKLIVQRLTDMMWIAQSSTYEDVRVYRFAQTMVALRECFNDLRQYYTQLYSSDIPSCLPNVPHPRFFPYPTAFERENGTITSWYYIKELHPANSEEMDPTCVTYLAQITGSQDLVVVKFVDRYGAAVHRFVANEGHAPELLYCGPLSRQTIPSPTTSFPGIALGPLQMVVMRYVKPCSLPASKPLISMREQLRSLFVKMHLSGYVFGDLRRPNVILDEKGTVQLIDFDWAGRYDRSYVDTDLNAQDIIPSNILVVSENSQDGTDYAIYPLDLSKLSFDKTGAKDLKPIRPVHDWRMLGMISLQDGL